ncbi:MAG TPA: type II toxin-antitoxin system HicA family toxin [Thermoanaerobaculia bacterium]|nr:type II toxin-antitoxin system HicA family toxin [Thermoanaerobaculia bacterium]
MSRLPSLRARELIAALKRSGFVESHQRGSHLYLYHPDQRLQRPASASSAPARPRPRRRSCDRIRVLFSSLRRMGDGTLWAAPLGFVDTPPRHRSRPSRGREFFSTTLPWSP